MQINPGPLLQSLETKNFPLSEEWMPLSRGGVLNVIFFLINPTLSHFKVKPERNHS